MGDHLPPLRPPPRPRSPTGARSQSTSSQRSDSSVSLVSTDSGQPSIISSNRFRPPQQSVVSASGVRPSTAGGPTPSQSTTSLQNFSRPVVRTSVDGSMRMPSPGMPGHPFGHRARQHSQGFFEPSLPHAGSNNAGLSASTIAAQAAMHNVSPPPPPSQDRKRSTPGLTPINTSGPNDTRRPSGTSSPQLLSANGLPYSNGTVGGHRHAATNAANAAFPSGRSPLPSPNPIPPPKDPIFPPPAPPVDKEPKSKSSKMKLFSKPKNITLSKDKESKVGTGAQSPNKSTIGAHVLRNNLANSSSTSLLDPASNGSSLYASANVSTSTLVPPSSEKEKEKHRHNFLSRGKNKLNEHAVLPLSSASSNSQATNPEKPQPLYSFTPDSPGAGSFAKSMSGLDLRHGGRALREKKREEKAAAAAKLDLTPIVSNTSAGDKSEYLGTGYETPFGPASGTQSSFSLQNEGANPAVSAQTLGSVGASMGLPGIGPDDAWPLLKARLLNLFSGESLLRPVEELNVLVSVHIRRCIQRKTPATVIEDLRELLQTGFASLAQTLRGAPDDKLITKLVEMWATVYGAILPFLQAVFLPLDLEFKGRGTYMSTREAEEFWGAVPEHWRTDDRPSSSGGVTRMPSLGEELDVRRITLITFRDTLILPKHEPLMAIFSRLSLGNIGAAAPSPDPNKGRDHARSDPAAPGAERPGTAGSLSPNMSSFNSQTSTLLDAASTSSTGAMSFAGRSRATSSTSAGSFGTSLPHVNNAMPSLTPTGGVPAVSLITAPTPVIQDPAKVTDTVARMLQCLYVLASCQTGDVGQGVVEGLTGALKYNWLGRGRTGGDRRGWVGMKNPGTNGRVGLVGA
ncbi:hypothetical protein Q7P37_004187 [Cladosporium fusiforme]